MVNETRARTTTRPLGAWRGGDRAALEALTPIVCQERRQLASSHLKGERRGHSLQPTAFIHEAYLRLADGNMPHFNGRSHFFRVEAQKRGGGAEHVGLLNKDAISLDRIDELLTIHEAPDLALGEAFLRRELSLRKAAEA